MEPRLGRRAVSEADGRKEEGPVRGGAVVRQGVAAQGNLDAEGAAAGAGNGGGRVGDVVAVVGVDTRQGAGDGGLREDEELALAEVGRGPRMLDVQLTHGVREAIDDGRRLVAGRLRGVAGVARIHGEQDRLDRSECSGLVDNAGELVDKCCEVVGLAAGEGSACSKQGLNGHLGLVSIWSLCVSFEISRLDNDKLTELFVQDCAVRNHLPGNGSATQGLVQEGLSHGRCEQLRD